MAEKRAQRRLAAILAADVVGYSRMMRENEAGTLAQLKTHRIEVFDPRIAEHNGRIVKTTGDGVLVEFASAVDATECAIKIQRALARRNEDVPEGHRIELRIGDPATFDFEKGGDIAQRLADLYSYCLAESATGDLTATEEVLAGLREAWKQGVMARKVAAAA